MDIILHINQYEATKLSIKIFWQLIYSLKKEKKWKQVSGFEFMRRARALKLRH